MEGFLTNVTIPVATLVFCLVLPQHLIAPIFMGLYAFYAGYLIAGRECMLNTSDSLADFQTLPAEEGTQRLLDLFEQNDKVRSVQGICKALAWCIILVGVGICFL